ncbi:unnamed protein product [Urochloa humidicola]
MSRREVKKVVLVLDPGSYFHCVSDPNLLHDLQLLETPAQLIGINGEAFPVLGRGSLQTDKFKLADVLYVPQLPMNVISVHMLCDIGYTLHFFGAGSFSVKDDKTGRITGEGHICHGLFVFDYLLVHEGRSWLQDSIASFVWMGRFALWLYLSLAQLITSYKKDNAILPMDPLTEEDEHELEKSSKMQPRMFGLSRLGRNLKQDENSRYHAYCTSNLVENARNKRRKIENARNKQFKIGNVRNKQHKIEIAWNKERKIHFILDSGACFHMTKDSSVLQSYPSHLNVKPPIQFITGVSGSKIEVKGVGYIDRADLRLDGVLFVPDVAENLVPFGQLLVQYPAMEGMYNNVMITFKERIWGGGGGGGGGGAIISCWIISVQDVNILTT